MWQNNGFGNNGPFQNNFNQDDYPPSPFGGVSGPPGQQYFPIPHHPSMYEDPNGGEGYMSDDFRPEVGLFNEGSFMQNQHQFVNSNVQFSPPPPFNNVPQAVTPTPPRPNHLNERAAKLKAQLLKGREGRGSSATPPVGPGLAGKQVVHTEGSSSLRGSPKTPIATGAENREQEQEQHINDLISQYSEPTKPAADASAKQEKKNFNHPNSLQRVPTGPNSSAKSQAPSLGSPTKVSKPATNGKMAGNNAKLGSRHASNGSVSDISEGEILEEPTPKRLPPTEPKQTNTIKSATAEQPSRNPREQSPPRRAPPANPKAQAPRNSDDQREEYDARSDNRQYQPDYKRERDRDPDSDKQSYPPHRDFRDEEFRGPDPRNDQQREENDRPRGQIPPTLQQLLPHDENLREWLDITGYHNTPYRDKILNRRRAIAALDAQREKLLAEMAAEERGVPVAGSQTPNPAMLPPPIPNKLGGRIDSLVVPGNAAQDTQRDRVVSNKRPYSDLQDPRLEASSGKIARVDDRGHGPRIKDEEDTDYRRPRSSGFDSARRSSFDRRDEREAIRYDEGRPRGRGRSRERDDSPGRRAYESRPPARTKSYEPDDFHDRDDYHDRGPRGAYEVRGNYRGRAYDSNYRGRGRGRGRGNDYHSHLETKESTSFGSRIANGKPYSDPKGFDRGGKGETRYFIVKSFNEDNVLKCIADGIWTTQVQNGSIFKQAFETCKNVILVFSINKSRAFQGYARMESLPGSVEVPEWQRAINWESAGAFKVRWLVICSTRFHRIGHLKNSLNENQAVLIGKDGQEIEENCGAGLIELINEEVDQALHSGYRYQESPRNDYP